MTVTKFWCLIEITNSSGKEYDGNGILQPLAESVGKAAQKLFPGASNVNCSVYPPEQELHGIWNSSKEDDIDSVTIEEFLSGFRRTPILTRIRHKLNQKGILTIGQLMKHSREEIMSWEGFGQIAAYSINNMLQERYKRTLRSDTKRK
jgi:DNA-directed RNA polymerase alpha subunit